MKDTPHFSTRYFSSYEEREEAFRDSVFSLIPRKYSGPRLFWKDFTNVSLEELSAFSTYRLAYITSNPRDGLAFGTPWQVLKAATLCARNADQSFGPSVEDVARGLALNAAWFGILTRLAKLAFLASGALWFWGIIG